VAAQDTCHSLGLLQETEGEFGSYLLPQSALAALESLRWCPLPGSLVCGTSAHLGTLSRGTFEVQYEALAQTRIWGPRRGLELQREIRPRGEEAAARLRSSQLSQDSGTGTVPVE
jgi:hypothetical protein